MFENKHSSIKEIEMLYLAFWKLTALIVK